MADRDTQTGGAADGAATDVLDIRQRGSARLFAIASLVLLLVVLLALAGLWVARRPVASNFLEREFDRRGVEATYRLDRVGLRTQQVSNLVIGDPKRPDLVARHAQMQVRIKWNGQIEVYRIVARGVRLRGRLVGGRVSWGQIDKLLPPPTDKPFQLPDFVLDVADSRISLATPFGPLGLALEGSGRLSGGFRGRLAAASPRLVPGGCQATGLLANVAVQVVARRPHVSGPVKLDRFACPASRLAMVAPRFDVDSRFNESFTNVDGRGRMAIAALTAGDNGLSAFAGDLSFRGTPEDISGRVRLSAQRSRLAAIYAERTRLAGRYRIGFRRGTMVMIGDYAAQGATLNDAIIAGITGPLAAAAGTPIGPIADAVGQAISRTARQFDASGSLRMVNFPGGGAARIETANARSASGARVAVDGPDGITYYWPSGRIRVDGRVAMQGGGLPTGRIALRQPRSGAPMSGVAQFAPYAAGDSRLALAPVRFAAARDGSTQISTSAVLDGPIPDGRVRGLRVPISGRLGSGGSLAFGTSCADVSFESLRKGAFEFGATSLPVCPLGRPIVSKPAGGEVRFAARIRGPVLNGRVGKSPLRLTAADSQIDGNRFALTGLGMRLGQAGSPIIFDAARFGGTLAGSGITGTFAGARSTVGNIPLEMSGIDGRWRVYQGDLSATGAMTVSDRTANPRFYPMRSDDVRFSLANGAVRASGTLRHPATGTRVTDVSIRHALSSGAGQALLEVPGITFGPRLQPEDLTRLTEGVVALVQGTVTGQGRINWSGSGDVTSSGEFSTAGMDLAAPFGPVSGLTTTVRFSDLLGLESEPGQVATLRSINPGILVENGVIRYQLLPNQMVRIEGGEWPFMGGRLILQETMLNFGRPSAKRLTLQLVGFDAKQFVDNLGFPGLEITGIFDGVLPMIFDESGGRIVGGRLDARPPGGEFRYTGTRPDAGIAAGVAFDLLSNLRYRSMIIRLDGELAGEFASRFTIGEIALGRGGGFASGLVRGAFRKVPLRLNLNIKGPFRALIQTAKGFKDPTTVIAPVVPFPLDAPGIAVETRTLSKEEQQTQTSPPEGEIKVSTPTPTGSER